MSKDRGHYWSEIFICPYYVSDEKDRITCENRNAMRFYTVRATKEFICEFCASHEGWKQCTIAQMLDKHYDKEYKDDKES